MAAAELRDEQPHIMATHAQAESGKSVGQNVERVQDARLLSGRCATRCAYDTTTLAQNSISEKSIDMNPGTPFNNSKSLAPNKVYAVVGYALNKLD